jgi:phosphoribosylformylglycinamidine synthase
MEPTMFNVELIVTPRPGVRDPQAEAVAEALHGLESQASGTSAAPLRVQCVGRYLRLQLGATDAAAAKARAEQLCRELLVNPNLESFELRIAAAGA